MAEEEPKTSRRQKVQGSLEASRLPETINNGENSAAYNPSKRPARTPRPRSNADDKFLKRLGRRTAKLRIASRLTREELAAKAHVHDSFIRKLESGDGNPSALVLRALAEALHVSLSALVDISSSDDDEERLARVRKPHKNLDE